MTNIILSGANGYMGKVISNLAANDDEIKIVAGFDINTESTDGFPVYAKCSEFEGNADVIVDFSHPLAFDDITDFAMSRKIPIVIATTGLSSKQMEKMKSMASEIPVFFSANYSIGVNLLIELVKRTAKALENSFDIEIVEKHHNRKIDAPSGTALAIADAITESISNQSVYIYDRHSVLKKRAKNEIGIHSIRGGTIVGEHDVIFAGNNENIEIKHSAASRDIFAAGAIRAAKFLSQKAAGYYTMENLLN